MRRLLVLALLTRLTALSAAETAAPLPQWIWSAAPASTGQTASFRHRFDVPHNAHYATLQFTCDNGATAYLNGKKVATNPDWHKPTEVDVSQLIRPNESNELRFDARNQGSAAGLVLRLTLRFPGDKEATIVSGTGWESAPTGSDNWQPARIVAPYGSGPWGNALDRAAAPTKKNPSTAIAASDITVPEGFTVEQLYVVPKDDQGSWVALTVDPKGRLIAGDQYGDLYRMDLPAPGEKGAQLKPQKLTVSSGKAHGLLFAFDSLYVMVNEDKENNGLYRLRDTDGDDQFDENTRLVTMEGSGEHGLHSMTVSPDGQRLYFNGGNNTALPKELARTRGAQNWAEDHLLPRMWDANGHARGKLAPGGFIASMKPDGSDVELFCHGFRNQFDIAFNDVGDLFTYDADMEWDIGTPWYRPTRVNHAISGGDYGWRSGSGKWPNHYPDSLPAVVDIGPGSPTGVVAGTGAKFPARYQHAVFVNDWTYGTMWAIHLTPEGGSYQAEKEEFLFGKPLPLTDVIIHPQDGALYFAIGGRRTQSAVYRVTYTGIEPTQPVPAQALTEEMKMRRTLESLQQPNVNPSQALDTAWPYLSHSDRFVRHAARIVIECQPVELWQQRALSERHPQALIEATIALARTTARPILDAGPQAEKGGTIVGTFPTSPAMAPLQGAMLETLGRLDGMDLSKSQQLAALRALGLVFTRLGKPAPDVCSAVADALHPLYPSGDATVDRELCQLLVFLDSPTVVSTTLSLMATALDDWEDLASDAVLSRNDGYARASSSAASSRPNRQQMAFMFALRTAPSGWTPDLRHTYFSWFPRAATWKGGNSFKGFIAAMRRDALAHIAPQAELARLTELSEPVATATTTQPSIAPQGPGRAWTTDEILRLTAKGFHQRNFEQGQAMFSSIMCLTCHRFNGDGGGIGPDISGAANRYTLSDFLENIIEPSKVVSDQYDSQLIHKTDGSRLLGRIVEQEGDELKVMTNPFAPTALLTLQSSDIDKIESQAVSMMPPGLINVLNEDELLDLLAYIMTGGNAQDPAFKK